MSFADLLPPESEEPFVPEVGEVDRAIAFGFRWAKTIGAGCWVRISDAGAGRYRLELAAREYVPYEVEGVHYRWWEVPAADRRLLDASAALQAVERVTGYHVLIVDEDGEEIAE